MTKLFQVAGQEIGYHLRQWTFYVTIFGMPLAFAALGLLPQLQAATQQTPLARVETIFNQPETSTTPTGYVDHAGVIA